ncbi:MULTISPECIES: hypothetical protein [Leeuwenhoekiella]|uniref:Uncharacterized protein n=2 Tax=Leeuwenhoekiella TaxID=283735 RepID=A0A2G1VRF5_9FLAO|nr:MULTISPECIES: hypothetical protein [Leeuwenhoekiella]MCC4213784.1 hypothetical protein [Leeuwenhoekiella parthenopeia]PHQ29362.1 hypothetical protein CJ305_10495 [Leeuwenhoekiella nanhaiensis]
MKTATVSQLKKELQHRDEADLLEICLKLAKFKKENKELLTYLLFESDYETGYVESVKELIAEQFETINTKNYYWMKKGIRKILKETKKYARYSGNKETEVALLLYFCEKMTEVRPAIRNNNVLRNLYLRQKEYIAKKIEALHEDLQLDYIHALEKLD